MMIILKRGEMCWLGGTPMMKKLKKGLIVFLSLLI